MAGLSSGWCIIVKHHCKTKQWNTSRSQGLWLSRERSYWPTAVCVGGWVLGISSTKWNKDNFWKVCQRLVPKHCSQFPKTLLYFYSQQLSSFLHEKLYFLWHKGQNFPCTVIQKLHFLLLKIEVRLKMFCNLIILSRTPNRDELEFSLRSITDKSCQQANFAICVSVNIYSNRTEVFCD